MEQTNYNAQSQQEQQPQAAQMQPPQIHNKGYQEEPCPPRGSIYEPIGVGRYMLLMLIAAIPFVNLIVYIIWAVSEHNVNIRNYAKAALIWTAIAVGLLILFWGSIVAIVASVEA